jgi:hypothetical protein
MNTHKTLLALSTLLLMAAPMASAASTDIGTAIGSFFGDLANVIELAVGGALAVVFAIGGVRLMSAGDDPVARKGAIRFMWIGGLGAVVTIFGSLIANWVMDHAATAAGN